MDLIARKATSSTSTILFRKAREPCKTICVLGTARGGTSMAAGVMRKIEVHMGDRVEPSNNEDLDFIAHGGSRSIAQTASYIGDLKRLVAIRNASHDVWGWKDPIATCYLEQIFDDLRNPVLVVVMRDLAALAQRARMEGIDPRPESMLDYMADALGDYRETIGLIKAKRPPTLIASYERILRAPRDFGAVLLEFLGLPGPPGFSDWIDAFIIPDKIDGSLDLLSLDRVKAHQFGATEASYYLIAESLRLRRDTGTPCEPDRYSTNLEAVSVGHYSQAVHELAAGNLEEAIEHATSVLKVNISVYPELAEGPLGLIARDLVGLGPLAPLPDEVCCAFYLIGFSNLVQALPHKAIINLTVAEKMMRSRLSHEASSLLCRANYPSCLFSLGLVAKEMGRGDIAGPVRAALAGDDPRPYLRCDEMEDYNHWHGRAMVEL